MKNFPWFKIYIILILIISLSFISLNILAQVEETEFDLKYYIKGGFDQASQCPKFIDMTELTMKDECTGLVWARHELPTYHGVAEPGYTWQEAYDSCNGFMTDINDSQPLFRLPTVEELLTLVKYQCDGSACFASIDTDITGGVKPFFSGGVYWTINDFNEPDHWTNPDAQPIPGNPFRDYKRSVNLLTGEVDTPVFSELFRLSAWCVVDRNPEIVEKKFINVTTAGIANGQVATGGSLETVYNRKCETNEDCSSASVGTTCEDITGRGKLCVRYDNYNSGNMEAKVVGCSSGYHIEDNICFLNPGSPYSECQGGEKDGDRCTSDADCTDGLCITACPSPEIEALGIHAYEAWKGSVFNGNRICRIDNCIDDFHRDPDSEICIPNKRPCFKEDPNGWTINFVEDWNSGTQSWGECRAENCTFDAVLSSGEPLSCECAGRVIEDVCINFDPAIYHYEINSNYDNQATCLASASASAWDGELCYDEVLNNPEVDCSNKYCFDGTNYSTNFCQTDTDCDNLCVDDVCSLTGDSCLVDSCPAYSYNQCLPVDTRREIWQGGLFDGYYECIFEGCQAGFHQESAEVCVPDILACTMDALVDPWGWVTAIQEWMTEGTWSDCSLTSCFSPTLAANTCDSGSDAGKSCSSDTDCSGDDSFCFSPADTCDSGPNAGQSCSSDADCPSAASFCFSPADICDSGLDAGQFCSSDTDCSGDDSFCFSPADTCDSGPNAGQSCSSDADCPSAASFCSLPICSCPSPYVIREDGTCTLCGNNVIDTAAGETCDSDCTSISGRFGTEASCDPVPVKICLGGTNQGNPCSTDANCPDGGTCELSQTSPVDVIFIVDTSPSFITSSGNLCDAESNVKSILFANGLIANSYIFGISDEKKQADSGDSDGSCLATVNTDDGNTVRKYIYKQETITSGCYNTFWGDEGCGDYSSQNLCIANLACAWSGTATAGECVRKMSFCSELSGDTNCNSQTACEWKPTIVKDTSCGDGYVFSGLTYSGYLSSPNPLSSRYPAPQNIVPGLASGYCSEDWSSAGISTIKEFSNGTGTLNWNSDSEKVIVFLLDESPYNGFNGIVTDEKDQSWKPNDYRHVKSSKRTRNNNESLIDLAKAENVKLSIIFTGSYVGADFPKGGIPGCSSWKDTWPDLNDDAFKPNKDSTKYCLLDKITRETGGVFQYGTNIMNETNTAKNITTAIIDAVITDYCDFNNDGIMDCLLRP